MAKAISCQSGYTITAIADIFTLAPDCNLYLLIITFLLK